MKKIILCIVFLLLPVVISAEIMPERFILELTYSKGKWVYPAFRGQKLYIWNNTICVSVGTAKYIVTKGIHTPFSFNGKVCTIVDIQREYRGCPLDGDIAKVILIEGVNCFDVNQDGRIDDDDLTALEDKIGEFK